MMQMMDAWTETFAAPGKRTTGTGAGWFAIAGPGWQGRLPEGVRRIDSPTNTVWLLGRIQTNTASDYAAVHEMQRQFELMPLSRYPDGPKPAPTVAAAAPEAGRLPPPARVARMSAAEFFRTAADLLARNQPHAADGPIMAKLARLGVAPGKPFDAEALGTQGAAALEEGAQAAKARLTAAGAGGSVRNGWRDMGGHVGHYGTDYQARAVIARGGLGANPPEDAVYLSATADARGAPLDGSRSYRLHFAKEAVPPVRAFWSLTLYDQDGYFAANGIHRYAIGDRDRLAFQPDGSLDLLIQAAQPGSASNWLPAPAGRFSLMLRLYWPEEQVLDGRWTPPPVLLEPAATGPAASPADPPEPVHPTAEISNGTLRATVYLPDAKTGYYRGTRFDWSGVIAGVSDQGHKYFGPWFYRRDPKVHDFEYRGSEIVAGPCSGTMGPVEEFSSGGVALGFNEAKPGGTFVQIGVGVLRRPDAAPYDRFRLYEVVDPGKWMVRRGAGWIEFTQRVSDVSGYGYVYRKTLRLVKGQPQMRLEHSLRNTGKRAIEAMVYDHNFVILDGQGPGKDFTVTFPFAIHAGESPDPKLAEIRGNQVMYLKKLEGEERVTATIGGFGASPRDYDIRFANATGTGVRVTGDQPLQRISLWSIRSNVSVEPFLAISAAPGKEAAWNLTYTFLAGSN
jgi:hypothetical protein